MTLPRAKARKRKATAAQVTKTLQGNPNHQPQQQQQQQPCALPATTVVTAQPPAPLVKKPRRGAVKPPMLAGESVGHRKLLDMFEQVRAWLDLVGG